MARAQQKTEKVQQRTEKALERAEKIVESMGEGYKRIEKTLADLAEENKIIKAAQQDTDRQIKETARQIKETDLQMQETDRQIKEYNRRFGDFTNRFGEIVEYMVAPNLRDKFRDLGLVFEEANRRRIENRQYNIYLEIDIMLENGDKALLVETKTKPRTEHVNEHIERLEKMRTYADLRGDKRIFLGAVAGVVMTKHIKAYILKKGLYAIEPSGETFAITSPEGLREW
ncbi:MAG: hypothetical protein LBD09_04395 [Treponema sp.]|nr:hypothetical protein [Treponema sp.]